MFEAIGAFEDDRESLVEFLNQLRHLLIEIAFERYFERFTYPDDDLLVFEDVHLLLYQRAIAEYLESNEFERLLELVRQLTGERLTRHGLSGDQLQMKREMVRVRERRFFERPGAGMFRRFVQAADVMLNSIVSATGAGTALSELKDSAALLPRTRR